MGRGPEEEPTPISLEEWQAAIAVTEGVRLIAAHSHSVTNPKTGEVITIPIREGDAEVFVPKHNAWSPVFRWRGGSAVFVGRVQPGDKLDPIWIAAVALASRLGAVIRGDNGEIYNLQTGTISHKQQ